MELNDHNFSYTSEAIYAYQIGGCLQKTRKAKNTTYLRQTAHTTDGNFRVL